MTPIPALPYHQSDHSRDWSLICFTKRIKDRRYQATKEQQPSPKHERGSEAAEKRSQGITGTSNEPNESK